MLYTKIISCNPSWCFRLEVSLVYVGRIAIARRVVAGSRQSRARQNTTGTAGCPHPTNKSPGGPPQEKIDLDTRCRARDLRGFRDAAAGPGRARRRSIRRPVHQRGRSRYRAGAARQLSGRDQGKQHGREEPGCKQSNILVLASDPNHLFLFEVYENEAAFQTHRASEHFKKYAALTANMVAKRVSRPMGAIGMNAKPH
jgi:Antibiotic biosynthesis monooxygenase